MHKTEHSCGGILYTMINGQPHYVLVREGYYGFPKGHMEAGETQQQTALREIREETGIQATLLPGPKWSDTYHLKLHQVDKTVTYFLASFQNQTPVKPPDELEEVVLLSYEEALDKSTHPRLQTFLKEAHTFILNNRLTTNQQQ